MAKDGLKKWFSEKWVDIGAKRKNGSYQPCGRSTSTGSSLKRKYPKCVPLAKATQNDKVRKGKCCCQKTPSLKHWP
jgi:hypothetical protein